ncbi:helix-turn-helix domain-containing protein [Hydrogenophaga sp. OTU3427]|jgi:DNA-binding transcriptional regulator YiaG|uniref:helix-turn-helix domain-containing protein n=1 Tax=Hydrogenophaga sp. OTU3427 TaxID=3043856 RepID=UPI00313DF232
MSTFNSSLKSEIARVARKELKDELLALRKTSTAHRSEIAALKRDVKALMMALRATQRSLPKAPAAAPDKVKGAPQPRAPKPSAADFDSTAFAAQRQALGITQAQMAKLVDASALSVYKWESGKVKPRAAQLERINAMKKLGKRAVAARLAE